MNADIQNRTPVPELGEGWYLLRADDGEFRNGDKIEFHDPRGYRDWETDRKSTRLNSSHSGESRMPSSA